MRHLSISCKKTARMGLLDTPFAPQSVEFLFCRLCHQQHLHLPWPILRSPATITIRGQSVLTALSVKMFQLPNKNTRPKTTTKTGIILWCGQAHFILFSSILFCFWKNVFCPDCDKVIKLSIAARRRQGKNLLAQIFPLRRRNAGQF